MARISFGRGGRRAPQGAGPAPAARQRSRRTPMGLADAKASNNLLVGLGVGLITTVTGLSAAGTFTAINAMNRQSEEAIAEAERYQQELDRQQAENLAGQQGQGGTSGTGTGTGQTGTPGQGGTGTDVQYPEDPSQPPVTQQPTHVDGMTREEFMAQLPEQIQWMIEKHITYDEYGLPRDEFGSLMNDPTTDIYDPARWSYFFGANNEEKEPKKEDLPTQSEIDLAGGDGESGETGETGGDGRPVTPVSDMPVKAPDKEDGYEDGHYEPDGMPIQNPAVEFVPGHTSGDASGGDSSDPTQGGNGDVQSPSVETPEPAGSDWWKGSDGEPLEGLSVDENGEPYYVVAPGDSLGSISRKYGFAMSDVVSANEIVNPNVLNVGDIIRFPASGPTIKNPGTGTGTGSTKPGTGTGGDSTGTGGTKPGTGGNTGNTEGVTTGNATGGSATGLG